LKISNWKVLENPAALCLRQQIYYNRRIEGSNQGILPPQTKWNPETPFYDPVQPDTNTINECNEGYRHTKPDKKD